MRTLIIWLAVVFVLSVYPFEGAERFPLADKLFHFMIYGITSVLFYTVLKENRSLSVRKKALLLSVVFSAGYGLLMEIVQAFIPARDFSVWDEVTNILGAVSGAIFVISQRRKR
jgi:VanZ family protein